MRTPLVAGNWKMNTVVKEAVQLVKEMTPELDRLTGLDRLICPPFVSLAAVHELLHGTSILLGAQNAHFAEKGAFTGEISVPMLSGLCQYVILGHSERRQYFNETGELVSKKVVAVLNGGLKPILCVGENLKEYEAGRTQAVVTEQLDSSLAGVIRGDDLTVAYEPVWAIGTGKAATAQQANATIGLIRTLIAKKYGAAVAAQMRILYGGSVTAANIAELAVQPEIDGALVGGASLKAQEFIAICQKTSVIRK